MEQIISQLAAQIGIDEALAQKAVGMVLALLEKQGEGSAVSQLFEAMPGAADLASEHADSGGGGGIAGMLGGLMGGGAGDAMQLVGALQGEGMSMDQIKELGSGLLAHAKENAGEDVVRQAVANIPGVSDYL